jgi:selenide,water dikinase
LVDATTSDDAAVYRISADRALVATADFFTPIVDDPFDFGRIAAANALSDVYAMGARPLFALNLVGFPRSLLGEGILEQIVRGAGTVAMEAGIAVLGGHSIDDAEPKFGLCVIGEVSPEQLVRNSTARAGDHLILTKPLGTGIIATAIKREMASAESIRAAVASMVTLNRRAAEAMLEVGVHAATDVTGYGLLGHLRELAQGSGLAARIDPAAVPLLPGAAELARAGAIPGGTLRNLEDLKEFVAWDAAHPPELRNLLCDAQTSGGLLIAVPANRLEALLERLKAAPTPAAARIGQLVDGPPGHITINAGP